MLIIQVFWRMYLAFFLFSFAVYPFTFIFPDDITFIRFRDTYYYGLFGIALLVSGKFSRTGLIGLIKPGGIDMPVFIWPKVDVYYSIVFIAVALSNAGVALYLPEDVWVDFKLFVPFTAVILYTIVVSILVSINIIKHDRTKSH